MFFYVIIQSQKLEAKKAPPAITAMIIHNTIPMAIKSKVALAQLALLVFVLSLSDAFIGYLITVGVFNLVYIIFSAIAAVKAYKGRMYYFVFFGRIAYHNTFRMKDEGMDDLSNPARNVPPKM